MNIKQSTFDELFTDLVENGKAIILTDLGEEIVDKVCKYVVPFETSGMAYRVPKSCLEYIIQRFVSKLYFSYSQSCDGVFLRLEPESISIECFLVHDFLADAFQMAREHHQSFVYDLDADEYIDVPQKPTKYRSQ